MAQPLLLPEWQQYGRCVVIDPLSELAIRHGTDKFGLHDYTPRYHQLFAHLRDRPLRLLEIGVGGYQDADRGGQSLAMWRDYFPQGQITGIDIQTKALDLGDRVSVLRGSQIDAEFLAGVVATRGPFDIIIDDGSHRNEHVIESYGILFPTLAPGGIYVAEDVQTAFFPRFGGSLDLDAPNSVGYFARIAARLGMDTDPLVADVVCISRFHNMIALHKDGGAVPLAQPSVTLDAHSTPAALAATFDALADGESLRIDGRVTGALAGDIQTRFVHVDHREIAIHFPRAQPHPQARALCRIDLMADGVILTRGANDYPSNFAFDATQPQAAAALAQMETVLRASGEEGGFVHYAGILTAQHGREAARDWIDRLTAMEARARLYFQLAIGLAQRDKGAAQVQALARRALEIYPGDAGFTESLVTSLLAAGETAEAGELLGTALALAPRSMNLLLLSSRLCEIEGRHDDALAHARKAVEVTAERRRAKPLTRLGELLAKAGAHDEARRVLQEATTLPGPFAPRSLRALSGVLRTQGNMQGALVAAEKALALAPDTREYQNWVKALRG